MWRGVGSGWRGGRGAGVRLGERRKEGAEGSAALSSLSRDDPVAPKAPLQLQVLQLLPQLLSLLLLLLLTETQDGGQFTAWRRGREITAINVLEPEQVAESQTL